MTFNIGNFSIFNNFRDITKILPLLSSTEMPTNKPISVISTLNSELLHEFVSINSNLNGMLTIGAAGTWCRGDQRALTGDFNGDGKADLWCNDPNTGENWFMLSAVPSSDRSFLPISTDLDVDGKLKIGNGRWCVNDQKPLVGDFDDDGKDDLWCTSKFEFWVMLSNGKTFSSMVRDDNGALGATIYCDNGPERIVGDFNGDGKADIWCKNSQYIFVILIMFDSFNTWWIQFSKKDSVEWCTLASGRVLTADFDGNGKDDLWCNEADTGKNKFILSYFDYSQADLIPRGKFYSIISSNSDGELQIGKGNWCANNQRPLTSDFNGDGKADLWCNDPSTGENFIMISTGNGFYPLGSDADGLIKLAQSEWCGNTGRINVGDFNGDSKADLWCNGVSDSDNVKNWVLLSKLSNVTQVTKSITSQLITLSPTTYPTNKPISVISPPNSELLHEFVSMTNSLDGQLTMGAVGTWCRGDQRALTGDFNGDGKADLWCNDPNTGENWFMLSAVPSSDRSFLPISTDLDVDGKLKIGNGRWCVNEQKPLVGDFDGNGKDDIWCTSNSQVWIMLSTGVTFISSTLDTNGGLENSKFAQICNLSHELLIGDFNGDRKDDIWCKGRDDFFMLSDGKGLKLWSNPLGPVKISDQAWCDSIGERSMKADFDGDGKDDVWCNDSVTGENWFMLSTENGFASFKANIPNGKLKIGLSDRWCVNSQRPLTADFNGDKKTDLWCNDPNTGENWFMISTGSGFVPFGYDINGVLKLGQGEWCGKTGRINVGDFNGDSKADLWCGGISGSENGKNRVLLSNLFTPTISPTFAPSVEPTNAPRVSPSEESTLMPTILPTLSPTNKPINQKDIVETKISSGNSKINSHQTACIGGDSVLAIWQGQEIGQSKIYGKILDLNGGQGSIFQLDSFSNYDQTNPVTVKVSNNTCFVGWISNKIDIFGVLVNLSENEVGTVFSIKKAIQTCESGPISLSVTNFGDEGYVLAYSESKTTNSNKYCSTITELFYNNGTRIILENEVSSTSNFCNPYVTSYEKVIIITDIESRHGSSTSNVHATICDGNIGPINSNCHDIVVSDVGIPISDNQRLSTTATIFVNIVTFIWENKNSFGNWYLNKKEYSIDGTALSGESKISFDSKLSNNINPSAISLKYGIDLITCFVWEQFDSKSGVSKGIYLRCLNKINDNQFDYKLSEVNNKFTGNSFSINNYDHANIIKDENGGFLLLFSELTGSNNHHDIYMQIFDKDLNKVHYQEDPLMGASGVESAHDSNMFFWNGGLALLGITCTAYTAFQAYNYLYHGSKRGMYKEIPGNDPLDITNKIVSSSIELIGNVQNVEEGFPG